MLIIDMPMPKNCWLCNLAYISDDYNDERGPYMIAICKADKQERTVDENETERPSWCPIKGELVTCGECNRGLSSEAYGDAKYCMGNFHNFNWFCSDGERKDGEHERTD